MVTEKLAIIKPFISWAGCQYNFLNELVPRLPDSLGVYHEPFFGSGALFFYLQPKVAILSDINRSLINMFRSVRDDPDQVFQEAEKHINEENYYLKMRSIGSNGLSALADAARFIYLNRTCQHGLFKENLYGDFITPYGNLPRSRILDLEIMKVSAAALNQQDIALWHYSFEMVKETAKEGDFILLDPPHTPSSPLSKSGFTMADQKVLANLFDELNARGCNIMMTNTSADPITALYAKYDVEHLPIWKTVPDGNKYKKVEQLELVVRNYR